MGGASTVLTSDSREELIEKAKEWYDSAMHMWIFPRDYIYGKGETEIVFHDCKNKDCGFCGGEPLKASIFVTDTKERPSDAESEHPFPFYSKFLKEEALNKRYFAFVSAHS